MRKGDRFIKLGLLLIAAALCLTLYNLWDSFRAGRSARNLLAKFDITDDPIPPEGRRIGEGIHELEYPRYILNPEIDMPTVNISGRDYVGLVKIPTLNNWLPVLDQWDYDGLRVAPCRYTGTAYQNNLVICAHNYATHFGTLKNLNYGDIITFKDMEGNVFNYAVAEVEILQPTDVEDMITGDWDLTLFTCTIGGQTRVTVRCVRT